MGAQGTTGGGELIEGEAGNFQNTIINGRLKTGLCFSCDRVGDLIQSIAQSYFGGYLGNGIAGGLRGKGRGTGDPRINLNDGILKTVRIQRELYVTAALNLQCGDDLQRGRAEHLELLIGQGLGGGNDDGVTGVDTHRVDVLHGTDGDDVSGSVPHDFKFDFLPARDTALDQHLSYPRKGDAPVSDLLQGGPVVCNTTACSAQCIGRAYNDGITYTFSKLHRIPHVLHHKRGDTGLVDGFHAVLEPLTVFSLTDGLGGSAQQANTIFVQSPVLIKGHGQV